MEIKDLIQKWSPVLEAGATKITNKETKKALAQICENVATVMEKKGLLTEATTGINQSSIMGGTPLAGKESKGVMKGALGREKERTGTEDFYLPNVMMPMLRRLFPSQIAHELVGVQALNGPFGMVVAYRAKYGTTGGLGTEGDVAGRQGDEIGFNPTDPRYTGVQSPDSLTSLTCDNPEDPRVISNDVTIKGDTKEADAWKAYAGAGAKQWAGKGADLAYANEFASFKDGTMPQIGFDFIKQGVEAKSRKLGAHYSMELAEDLEAVHGFDVESELVNMISFELGAEIDRQLVTEMATAAIQGGSITGWNPAAADGLDQMGRLQTLLTQVSIEAQQIAIKTRRGRANFVIASPRVSALLEQMSLDKFVSIQGNASEPSVPDSGVGALVKTGLINSRQQLLVTDTYAAGEYILMGYKGKNAADNGIIYCPYIPVNLVKAMDPDTLTPVIGARTRYGVMSSVWDAKNYYHFMAITGLSKGYSFSTTDRQFIQPYSAVTNGTLFV